jgi:hypothetical protein
MARPPQHRRFGDLNWLGKTVYVGGAAMRLSANVLDHVARRASSLADEARREFEREMDPNIEDAKILEERPHRDDEG